MAWCPDRGALTVLAAVAAWRVVFSAPDSGAPQAPKRVAMATASATNPAVAFTDAAWRDLASLWDATGGKPVGSPVENLTLPLEHHLNGRVRAVLHARTASLADDNYVRAWKVTVELFTAEGLLDGRIEADAGLFDRASRRGYCRGAVSFTRQDARVAGEGLYWAAEQQQLRILAHGEVRARMPIGRMGGMK